MIDKTLILEIGAVVLAVGAVGYFMTQQGAPTSNAVDAAGPQPTPETPNYLTYNTNKLATPGTNLASVAADQGNGTASPSQPSCSCGAMSGNQFFTGPIAFEESLYNSLSGYLDEYEQNVYSQFPTYVSQFFNNPSTLIDDTVANSRFSSLQGA